MATATDIEIVKRKQKVFEGLIDGGEELAVEAGKRRITDSQVAFTVERTNFESHFRPKLNVRPHLHVRPRLEVRSNGSMLHVRPNLQVRPK